jgi:hypothetical protein
LHFGADNAFLFTNESEVHFGIELVFVSKRDDVTGELGKLHEEELNDL